jgi:multiple sugar transport system substrate-binding protein
MSILAGLAVLRRARDIDGATALIDYLSQLDIQLATARSAGFFPTLKADLSTDPDRGLKMGATALFKTQSARDALPVLPPVGLGARDAEFDKVFIDTFHQIVLRGHNPRSVLDQEAEVLRRLLAEVGAPCWAPDAPGAGACDVQ